MRSHRSGLRKMTVATAARPNGRFVNGCYETEREFVIDPPDGWLQLPLCGLLSGEPTSDETTIEHIGAGWDRSPC